MKALHLTPHFTLAELIASEYAQRHGINNVPVEPSITGNLHVLASGLERCRAVLGAPMVITSGYRNPEVNAAVGGSQHSAHMRGLAADFKVPGLTPLEVCRKLNEAFGAIGYEQIIQEGTWTHIAFPEGNRDPSGEVLTAHFSPGRRPTYTKGLA